MATEMITREQHESALSTAREESFRQGQIETDLKWLKENSATKSDLAATKSDLEAGQSRSENRMTWRMIGIAAGAVLLSNGIEALPWLVRAIMAGF